MKQILSLTIASLALSFILVAQDAPIFPKGEKSPNVHHVGNVWLKELNHPDSNFNFSISVATFDPGARLDWHVHPGGQILLITQGTGYYQEKGKKRTVRKGDVIKCLPGVEHWHGSTPGSGFTYIASSPTQKGGTKWLHRVTDQEYGSAKPETVTSSSKNNTTDQEEIISLSKEKWRWMSEKNADTLATLFHEKAMFVHMGGSWGKDREVDIIKGGGIHYKKADIHEVSVNIIGNTAILLNRITLLAVVGGNEVTNPFMVTEVYIKDNGKWTLGSLSFTRLVTPQGQ